MKGVLPLLKQSSAVLALVLVTLSSHAAITLDAVLDTRRSIVQSESQSENALATVKQNEARIASFEAKISEINGSLEDVKRDIAKNEKGMSDFPEMAASFRPKITALIDSKAKLLAQRKEHEKNIDRLKDENHDLRSSAAEHKIDADKQSRQLAKLKQSYLDKRVSDTVKAAEQGQTVLETQVATCSFLEIYGQHKGNRQVCLNRAIEQAKRTAAEKYAPTNITSEINSKNFEITSETSSQYYAVDVNVAKEFKSDTWVKMEPESERFKAQFKGQILITPAFTKKTRQKLMERYAVELSAEIGQVAAMEKRKTIEAAKRRIEKEAAAKLQEQRASEEYEALRREIELLKKANSARQIQEQQQAAAKAEKQRELDRQSEESRIQAEVARRLAAEKKTIEKEAQRIEKEEEREVFVPPVF